MNLHCLSRRRSHEKTFIDCDALISASPFGLEVPALNASSASPSGEGVSRRGQKRDLGPQARDKADKVKVHRIADG